MSVSALNNRGLNGCSVIMVAIANSSKILHIDDVREAIPELTRVDGTGRGHRQHIPDANGRFHDVNILALLLGEGDAGMVLDCHD